MKNKFSKKYKNVLITKSAQGMAELSLAAFRGLKAALQFVANGPLFSANNGKDRVRRLAPCARMLSGVCGLFAKNIQPTTGSTSCARALSLLWTGSLHHGAGSTSCARALSQLRGALVVLLLGITIALPLWLQQQPAVAAPADTLNFQGRLLTSSGSLVPDGNYHIEFKLYDSAAAGASAQGVCVGGGTDDCLWVETRTTGNLVSVQNGYYSVYLGDVTSLPDIDWSQELYLTMNIGGAGGAASWDGEMSPRFKLTAVPYAFTSANVASGNTNAVSTNSNDVTIQTGDALGATSNSGNITIDTGTATGTAGALLLGTGNASALTIGNASVTTTLQGSVSLTGAGTALTVTNNALFNGDVTVGSDTSDTLTVEADAVFNGSLVVSAGDQFTNAGSTLFTSLSLGPFAADGAIGTAAATVDVATTFDVTVTTSGIDLTLPTPTSAVSGRVVYINNVDATNSITIEGNPIAAGESASYIWNGTGWVQTISFTSTGVDTLAAIGSSPNANGATISGTTLTLQPANGSFGGVVTTLAQTFAGDKTFTGSLQVDGNTTLGDASGDTLTVNAGSIQFANNFTSCTAINTDASGNLGCDTNTYLTNSLTDNITDAFDLQEGTNNYININTTDGSENISFGNATTNPDYNFLGSGALTVAGATTINNTLAVNSGTITNSGVGQSVSVALGNDGDADQVVAFQVNATSANTGDSDDLVGIYIADILSPSASVAESGLIIGSGWDHNAFFADTSTFIGVAPGGTIAFTDDVFNNLLTITDAGTVGNVGVTGTLIVSGATTINDTLTVTDTVTDSGALQTIDVSLGNDGDADFVFGLQIDVTSANTGDADALVGLVVNDVTSPSASVSESGIVIGSGYDYNLVFYDTSTNVQLIDGGVLTVTEEGGDNALFTITDAGTVGNVGVTGTLQVGALGTANTSTFLCRNSSNIIAGCSTTPVTSATAFIQNGNDFGGNAVLGTNTAGQTLAFETAGTTRFTLSSTVSTLTGNGATSILGGSSLNLGSTGANTLTLATNGTTRFTLANGASTLTGNGATSLVGGTTLAVNAAAASALNIGTTQTSGVITIGGTAAATGTINIGTGTGAQSVNLGTGGTGAKTVTVGSTASSGTTTIQSGSGGINLSPASTGDVLVSADDDTNLQVTGTLTNSGAAQIINVALGNDGNQDIIAGLQVNATSGSYGDDDNILGVFVNNITGYSNTTELGLGIGTGWDADLAFLDDTPVIAFADGGTLMFSDSSGGFTNNLFSIEDVGTVGNVNVTGTLQLDGLGTANTSTFLCRNSSSIIAGCATTPVTSATGFIQGGNDFGATAVLGTAASSGDALQIITDGTTAITVDTSQNTTFAGNVGVGAVSSTARFNLTYTDSSSTAGTTYGSLLTVADNGTISSGTDTIYGQRIDVDRTNATDGTNVTYGQFISSSSIANATGSYRNTALQASASGGSIVTGLSASAFSSDADSGSLYGGTITVTSESASPGTVQGLGITVTVDDGAPVNTYGLRVQGDISGASGTITNAYGIQVDSSLTFGATNSALLALGTSSVSGNYSIYSATTAESYFAGALTVEGAGTFQNSTDSTTAFQILESSGAGGGSLLTADTTNFLLKVAPTQFLSSGATQSFGSNGSITGVDDYSTIAVDATATDVTVTLPAPAAGGQVVGRVIYVTAVNGSEDFTLSLAGTSIDISMKANSTATLIWNGTGWTAAGASSSTDLQSAYNNTLTSAGGAELVLNASGGAADGLTIRNNSTSPIFGGLLEVQTSIGSNLFSVNNNAVEYASNGGAESQGASSSTFPANTWSNSGSSTVTRYTTAGTNVATGQASVSVVADAVNEGAANELSTSLTSGLTYTVSFTVRGSANFSTLNVDYSPDGSTSGLTNCVTGETVTTGQWARVSCSFVASGSIDANNAILIRQSDATSRTFYIDNLSVSVNASATYAADGSVDSALGSNWTAFGTLDSLTRDTSVIYDTSGSVNVDTPNAANRGVRNNLPINPDTDTQYLVTFYARSSNTFNDIRVRYSRDGGTNFVNCVDYNTQSVSTTGFTEITCVFTTDSTTPTNPDLIIDQPTGSDRNFYIDALTVTLNTNTANNVQVGGGSAGGPVTLLTLDRSAGAPIADNNDAYLGSMYYDTVTGRIQCYEADGWGACGAAPDNVVNLNPEYAGSVLNGSGVGTMTADFCSDGTDLTVNDSFCDPGEAKNFYNWTSPQATEQTYSIYVTYQLPETFNGFSSDDTVQLVGRVDNTSNASVTYEMFHSTGSDVTQCGTGETDVITGGGGSADTWYSYGINGNESTGCALNASAAGDFIIFKINLKAQSNANAYVSTLRFVTTGR